MVDHTNPAEDFPHEQDDIDMLMDVARNTVDAVMHRNTRPNEEYRWRTLTVEDHIEHAVVHLEEATASIEDLEHALVRCAMAIAKVEWL